jgi:Family of unknown function (DUF5670)
MAIFKANPRSGNPPQTHFCNAIGNLTPVPRNLPHDGPRDCFDVYGRASSRRKTMLWTITIILFILWLVGMVSSYTLGGWIHILLVLAVVVLIFNLLSGRRAV